MNIAIANIARAYSAFVSGWNWMYEVVSDFMVQRCFDIFDLIYLSSIENSQSDLKLSQLVLAVSIIFAGFHAGEEFSSCSLFPNICQDNIKQNKTSKWREHDRDLCKRRGFDTLEQLMGSLTKKAEEVEGVSVCLLQALFIHYVCCRSEGRKAANLSSDSNFSIYSAMENCCKFYQEEERDNIPEDEKRLFWNILCFDNMATLKMFDIPKLKYSSPSIARFLPKMVESTELQLQLHYKKYKVRRYALNWIRAKVYLATTDVCHAIGEWIVSKRQTPYSTVQEASRKIELCKLELPAILRIQVDNESNIKSNIRDYSLVRLRYLIAVVIDKAIECVHRIALTEMVIASDHSQRQESCQEAIQAAQRCINHFTQLRILYKNPGDTNCVWHMNLPSSILTLSVACVWQANFTCFLQHPMISPISITAMQAISSAIELLEATSEKEKKWFSLRVLARLKTQLQSLIFCDGIGLGGERISLYRFPQSSNEIQSHNFPHLGVFGLQGTFAFIKLGREKLQRFNDSQQLIEGNNTFEREIQQQDNEAINNSSTIDNLGIVEWLDQFFESNGYITGGSSDGQYEIDSSGTRSTTELPQASRSHTHSNTFAQEEDPILIHLLQHQDVL